MSSISLFNPFRRMSRLDPFSDEFFRGFALQPVFTATDSEPQMRLNVTEDKDGYCVKAEIPGVHKNDINVSIDGSQVSISAEVLRESSEKEDSKVIREERYYGQVARSFTLPQEVNEAKAQARYEDGVLTLTLPKMPGSSPKHLTVM